MMRVIEMDMNDQDLNPSPHCLLCNPIKVRIPLSVK